MGFYVESVDRPYQSAVVAEDIDVGEYAALNSSGNAERFEQQNHGDDQILGVATQPLSGQQVREDDDATGGFTYLTSENDRASFAGREDDSVIKVKTTEETTDGVTNAPSISHGDVVGFVDTSDENAPAAAGRLVEEGYTNDEDSDATSTTFNRTNANFYALGIAYRPTHDHSAVTSYDEPVRVRVLKDALN